MGPLKFDAGQTFFQFRSEGIEKDRTISLKIMTAVLLRRMNRAVLDSDITSVLYIQQILNIKFNKYKCFNIDLFVKGVFVEYV